MTRAVPIAWAILALLGCSQQSASELVGHWTSAGVRYPSSELLGELSGTESDLAVIVDFRADGGFLWTDSQGLRIEGRYSDENGTLILRANDEEAVEASYRWLGDLLYLRTPDGFEFRFRRGGREDSPPG